MRQTLGLVERPHNHGASSSNTGIAEELGVSGDVVSFACALGLQLGELILGLGGLAVDVAIQRGADESEQQRIDKQSKCNGTTQHSKHKREKKQVSNSDRRSEASAESGLRGRGAPSRIAPSFLSFDSSSAALPISSIRVWAPVVVGSASGRRASVGAREIARALL